MMEQKEFYANRSKYAGAIFCAILMLAAGLFVLYQAIRTGNIASLGLGTIATLFFGLCFIGIVRSFLQRGPTLTIDADGVVLANYTTAVGRIPWSNIKGTKIQSVTMNLFQRLEYLTIDVVDQEAIFASVPKWKRLILKANMPYFATPVFIGSADLKAPLTDVQLALENALYAKRTQYRREDRRTNERVAEPLKLGR